MLFTALLPVVACAALVAGCGGAAQRLAAGPPAVNLVGSRECQARSLSAAWSFSGVSAGHQVTRVVLVNTSSRACALVGHPVAITGVRADGRIVGINGGAQIGAGSPYTGDRPAILDRHGGTADLALITDDDARCTRHPPLAALTALRIRLLTGTVTAQWNAYTDAGTTYSFPCPPSVTTFAGWTG